MNNISGEPIDTLRFTQINKSASISLNWNIQKTESVQRNLSISFNGQGSASKGNDSDDLKTSGYTESITFRSTWTQKEAMLAISLNANQNAIGDAETFMIGPSVSINKSFFDKKLRTGIIGSYNLSIAELNTSATIVRLNNSITISKRHYINNTIGFSFRDSGGISDSNFTASLGYSFSF